MSTPPRYRLAETTLIEPLIDSWAAWWMLVSPFTASLHLQNFQLPVLRAYLQSPEFHAKASRDPALQGTAFVGIPARDADRVRELLQSMLSGRAEELRLAEALQEFQARLHNEAKGQSVEYLYRELPAALRGLVELVYDYHHRPSLRLLEGAGYRSRHYRPALQSLRLSTLQDDLERPSLVSTPRVMQEGHIDWRVPFADERVDRLFELDTQPQPLTTIQELLGEVGASSERLLPLLTEAPLAPWVPWEGPGLRVRYLGHATALVQWKGVSLLFDPVIGPRPRSGGAQRHSFADLPPFLDYVVVTHTHADHFALDTLLRLRGRVGRLVLPKSMGMLVGDVSLRLMARALGFKDVVDLEPFESLPLPDGELVAIPFLGEHGDIAHSKSAYVVRAGRQTVLFAADSACLDEGTYAQVREVLGPIGTVFMNTETEGSPLTFTLEGLFPKKRDRKLERDRRCRGSNVAEGLRLLELVGASRCYNYAMGLEPWLHHIIGPAAADDSARMRASDELLTSARARGLIAERLRGPTDFVLET
jgi:L-ascorbate metabolism protein UlaG (beta-lactamase superfamily)